MLEGVPEEHLLRDLPGQFSEEHLTARYLVPRLALCAGAPSAYRGLAEALHQRLLPATVTQFRRHCPVAREILASVTDDDVRNEGTRALPLMHREQLEGVQARVCAENVSFSSSSFTRGSVGEPMMVYRSREELVFRAELLAAMGALGAPEEEPLPRGITLRFGGGLRGSELVTPQGRPGFVTGMGGELDYATILRLVQLPFEDDGEERRIDTIEAGGTNQLLALTQYLAQHAPAGALNTLRRVYTGGRLMSRRERRLLDSFWPCPIHDVFSFTELWSAAVYDRDAGGFRFDPFSIYEVVGIDDAEPIVEGRGRLAVTALYPLHQMMPFIRYLTGDLVEVSKSQSVPGERVFRPLGRDGRHALVGRAGSRVHVLGAADVFDTLDEFAEVRRNLPSGTAETGCVPLFSLATGADGSATLAVEMKFDPALFEPHARELRQRILAELAEHVPGLSDAIASGLLDVELVAPGTLTEWEPRTPFRDYVGMARRPMSAA